MSIWNKIMAVKVLIRNTFLNSKQVARKSGMWAELGEINDQQRGKSFGSRFLGSCIWKRSERTLGPIWELCIPKARMDGFLMGSWVLLHVTRSRPCQAVLVLLNSLLRNVFLGWTCFPHCQTSILLLPHVVKQKCDPLSYMAVLPRSEDGRSVFTHLLGCILNTLCAKILVHADCS